MNNKNSKQIIKKIDLRPSSILSILYYFLYDNKFLFVFNQLYCGGSYPALMKCFKNVSGDFN